MPKSRKIVILYRDPLKRSQLKQIASESGHTPFCFEKIAVCLDNLNTLSPDLIIVGPFPPDKISRVVNFVRTINSRLPLIMVGVDDSVQDLMASYHYKNITCLNGDAKIKDVFTKIDRLTFSEASNRQMVPPPIVGNTPEMVRLRKECSEICKSNEAVLIQGETGAGKDLVAQTLHAWSNRAQMPLVKIGIAAYAGYEIFDNSKTWKHSENAGAGLPGLDRIFDQEKQGALYLDGIENLSSASQERLADFLRRDFNRDGGAAGGLKKGSCIISSARVNLETLVENGQFDKDLFCRLSVFTIKIPPLRQHPEDIPLLVDYFTDQFCRRLSNGICDAPEALKDRLREYDWPGNCMELSEVVKNWVVSGFKEETLDGLEKDTGKAFHPDLKFSNAGVDLSAAGKGWTNISMKGVCKQLVADTEKKLIKKALRHHNWNRKKAALMLDISYRSLLNKIKQYRLS